MVLPKWVSDNEDDESFTISEEADDDYDNSRGLRTRGRARKEEKQRQLDQDTIRAERQSSVALHPNSAKIHPAAFPSLDTAKTIEENRQATEDRDLEQYVGKQSNPFAQDEEDYLGQPDEGGLGLLSAIFAHQFKVNASKNPAFIKQEGEQGKQSSGRLGLSKKAEGAVIQDSVRFYTRNEPDPTLYKTFLTQSPCKDDFVRWHQLASEEEQRKISHSKFPVSPLSPSDSDLAKDHSDSDSESGSTDSRDDHSHSSRAEDEIRKVRGEMAENVPPSAGAAADDATRGMPYYDRLKKTLKTSIKQKQDIEETLAKIEQSIWAKEASYLDDTSAGNIMKGFDNYIKASGAPGGSVTGSGTASRKKATVGEQDRLFSRSSVGFWNAMTDTSPHASATSTPSHAHTPKDHPTPGSTTSTKHQGQKKKKATAADHDDSDGKPPNKRLKITFSRNDKD